jgi:fused signal recognition particle receptor
MGFFDKLKTGLSKTRSSLFGRVAELVTGHKRIDEALLEKLEEVLISSDVGVGMTNRILERMRTRVKREGYDSSDRLVELLKEEVAAAFQVNGEEKGGELIPPPTTSPYVIMVVGVNGVGKTTSIGKLAYNYHQAGYRVIVGAADTFRAAANEQLEIWAKRAGVQIVQQPQGADPASVAFDALSSALAKGADVVIIDTAGRLHTKVNLMEELKKIKRVLEKRLPGAPHDVLLVLDASTGQNGLQQVRQFHEAVSVTGIVLTKLDGTAKGGIVLAASDELNVPIKYVGVGEQIDDLQPFRRRDFVDALFDNPNLRN